MISRMSNRQVATPADYMTGKAHPTAFTAADLDAEKMVPLTYGIEALSLPPLCVLHEVEEDERVVGRDYCDVAPRERRPISPGDPLESNRVDIAVFVRNEMPVSAPGFVSLSCLDNEQRKYDEQRRIRVVDYKESDTRGNYVDPLLDLPKDWWDEYLYGDDGHRRRPVRRRVRRRQGFGAAGGRGGARRCQFAAAGAAASAGIWAMTFCTSAAGTSAIP
jgi:hypothetical protein